MIRGAHLILYSSDAAADRAVLRDLIDRPTADVDGDWLIVQLPPGELAVHPAEASGDIGLYLVCDDVDAAVAELSARGMVFEGDVHEQRWGRATTIRLPSGARIGLYQPTHETAFDL